MGKINYAYNLENSLRLALSKKQTKTAKCLIYAAMAVRFDADKKCDGETFVSAQRKDTVNIWINKKSLKISFNRNFGYKFTYDESKDSFKVSSFVNPYSGAGAELATIEVKPFHEEMQAEIDNDVYLPRYIKAIIKTALMPADCYDDDEE
jgi:hypothetical protein|nr:MAG TPA: hypothetical protein [Caudoviricetes sp.]